MKTLIIVMASFFLLSACESDTERWKRSAGLWCNAMYAPEEEEKLRHCPEYFAGKIGMKSKQIDAEAEFKKAKKICEKDADAGEYRACMPLMFVTAL